MTRKHIDIVVSYNALNADITIGSIKTTNYIKPIDTAVFTSDLLVTRVVTGNNLITDVEYEKIDVRIN